MDGMQDRQYWQQMLLKIADPVLIALSERRLKADMPIEEFNSSREDFSHLEALARTLLGMAPWLELEDKTENAVRQRYAGLARMAIDAATDPDSPDYCNFTEENSRWGRPTAAQPIVDAAFLCHAFLRAPNELWYKLESRVKHNVINAMKLVRQIRPFRSNWLLFSAIVEAGLGLMGERADMTHVDYALYQFEQWYKGDGVYGDGIHFGWDYYNSFVIQPMLLDVVKAFKSNYTEIKDMGEKMEAAILKRAKRYAAIQEMFINTDGSYPAIGRSITYRCGAFQLLAQMALMKQLPERITPAQVRCALTAVIKRCMGAPGTFDEKGWLKIGLYGSQPALGEPYISTGSLYLCTAAFLPLGLPPKDEFWHSPAEKWSSQKIWSGENVFRDHAEH